MYNIEDDIKNIISEVTGIDGSILENDLLIRDELMIDSLKEMEIIVRVEKYFSVKLNTKKLMKIKKLKDFINIVKKAL